MPAKKKDTKKPESTRSVRKLVADVFASMDGVMQAPGGAEEDPDENFRHGGWSMAYWDEAMGKVMDETMAKPSEIVLGRKTYDIFVGYWPKRDDENAAILNRATKHVASRSRKKLEWANASLLDLDVVAAVRALKQKPGPPLHTIGSANLLQTLLKNDLVDELELWIFPVVVGTGKKLFDGGGIPTAWKLTKSVTSTTGVLMLHYERNGDIVYASAM